MKMAVLFYFRALGSAFYCCVLWMTLTNGDKGILLEEPKSKWKDWIPEFRGNAWRKVAVINGFAACSAGSSTEQWLIAPFIHIPPSVKTFNVKFNYTVRSCASLINASPCSETFKLVKRDENSASTISGLRKEPFTDLANIQQDAGETVPVPPATAGPKSTYSGTFQRPQTSGVYFAIKVEAVCMALFSFEVSYGTCPSQGVNLVKFEETISPEIGSPKITVNGTCVKHAFASPSSSRLYAFCDSSGVWTAGVNVLCVCTMGHQQNVTLNTCESCPVGFFKKKVGNEPCTKCPLHSSQHASRTECSCDNKYYRAPGEDASYNCTSIPSVPLDGKKTFINASAVQLVWKEPKDTGGRSDLFYEVKCLIYDIGECGSNVLFYPKSTGLKDASVFVSGLLPYTRYTFKVCAKNGVSGVATDQPNYKDIILITKESLPGKPVIHITREKGSSTAHLQWSLEEKNGKILFYEVRYYNVDSGSNGKVNSTYMNITIRGLDPESDYLFDVRAYTSVGFGKFSDKIVRKGEPDKGPFSDQILLYAGIATAGFVLLLIIIIVVLCCRKRSNRSPGGRFKDLEMLQGDGQRLYIDPSTYGDLLTALTSFANELSKNCVKLEKIIGGGEFGEVHKGVLTIPKSESETVAVKLLKRDATLKSRDDFLSEAAVLGQFNHLNVIEMKGVVTKSAPMMIILEFMENGSLDNFLKAHDGHLTTLQLIGMARGVAAGMAYLAEMNFIHRDLAARNILVAENMACKVADFGLSRELENDNPDSEYMTQGGKIAVRWTALEAIKYRKFSSASDVWSYGILLWEIMTFSERPYWDWTNFQVMDRIEAGFRLPIPTNCPKAVYHIMLDCWIEDKTRRPRFTDIVQRLEELIRSPDLLRDDMIGRVSRANTIDFDQIETVQGWLDSIHMGQYKPNFTEAGYVTLKQLVDVDDGDLVTIGVKLIGHRNKIKKNLKGLQDYLHQSSTGVSLEVKI